MLTSRVGAALRVVHASPRAVTLKGLRTTVPHRSNVRLFSSTRCEAATTSSTELATPAATSVDAVASGATHAVSEVVPALEFSVGGPVDLMTYILYHMHDMTGLPWWGTLAVVTLSVRTLLFPMVIRSTKNVQKLQVIKKDIDALSAKIKEAQNTDPALVQHYAGELSKMFKDNGCHPLRSLQMPLLQIPVFMSFFFGIQRMATDGLGNLDPSQLGFTTGGLAHVVDLTLPDPYFILPVITSVTMLAVIELGADGSQPMAGQMKMVMRGMSVIIVPFTASMPSGLFCYWLSNNLFSLSQVAFLKIPPVRDAFGLLPPSAIPKPEEEAKPAALQFATAEQLSNNKGRVSKKAKKEKLAAESEAGKESASS